MYYTINNTALRALVEEEVSHIADAAYGEDGTPLYDSVAITSKDWDAVDGYLEDAAGLLVRRNDDIARHAPLVVTADEVTTTTPRILFNVPDMASSQEPFVQAECDRYMAVYAACALMQSRRPTVVPELTSRIQNALDDVKSMLRKREDPSRT
jgi:hypothetical protein